MKSTWQRWGGDGDGDAECFEEAGNGKRSRCLAHRRSTTTRDELAETDPEPAISHAHAVH